MRNACNIMVRKPRRRGRCRWEHNIRMNLREIGWEGVDWIHMAQDREQCQALVNIVMNLQVP
jgi:glycine cleavage system protein P-like pyridoxal-binding family